jgi:hypothetical protein
MPGNAFLNVIPTPCHLQACRGLAAAAVVAAPRNTGIQRLKAMSARSLQLKVSESSKQGSDVDLIKHVSGHFEPAGSSLEGCESPQQQSVIEQVRCRQC